MTRSEPTKTTVFDEIVADYHANDFKLGMPSTDDAHFDRRKTVMEKLSGGKGWRIPAKEPKRNAQGLSRGDRKRLARAASNERVSEDRPYLYMHSAARRRALAAEVAVAA